MYAVRYPVKGDKGDRLIAIASSYSVGGKKKRRIHEYLGLLSKIKEEHGDAEAFIRERIEANEERLRGLEGENASKAIDYGEEIGESDGFDDSANAGYLFLQRVWSDMGLEGWLNKWKHDSKARIAYSMNDAMRLMCFSRVIQPGSKLSDIRGMGSYIEPFSLHDYDLYDALGRIDGFSERLMRKISRECASMAGGRSPAVYYDCTNFYFEIEGSDGEDGLRAYGVEKNHRPDPIVEFGLLLSEDGYPIGCSTFRGNESEKTSLKPLLIASGDEATEGCVVCADAGLNTKANKDMISGSGRNYVFSQHLGSLSEDDAAWAVDPKGYGACGDGGAKCKSRWIKRANGTEERLIAKCSPKTRKYMLAKIDERVGRAQKFVDNPSKLTYKGCQDGKEYIKKIVVDKDGEIVKAKSVIALDEAKIEEERAEAGYDCLVTDIPRPGDLTDEEAEEARRDGRKAEPMTDGEVMALAGRRNSIEDVFRCMKTDMSGRPIYVRTPEHIRAHLVTVYIAIALLSVIRGKYLKGVPDPQIFDSLRKYSLVSEGDLGYRTVTRDANVGRLIKAMDMGELAHRYITRKGVRSAISKSKGR
jgi:hypothetical protein